MKLAQIGYTAPTVVAEAVGALAEDDAIVLAGGQSLVPLLAMRLARPALLVDVNALPLGHIVATEDGFLALGALVRHHSLTHDQLVASRAPLLAKAARLIGHPAIRHRGTLGGSIAHADPSAELPAALIALRGFVVAESAGGRRSIAAHDFFQGIMTTSLDPRELVVEVQVPSAGEGQRAAVCQWSPRHNDFAESGIALATSHDDDGAVLDLGAAAFGVGTVPVDITGALSSLMGERRPSHALLREVAGRVHSACGSGDRAELAGLLAAQAVAEVLRRDMETA